MPERTIYAEPGIVHDAGDGHSYHTLGFPGTGCVEGGWDPRGKEIDYLGGIRRSAG